MTTAIPSPQTKEIRTNIAIVGGGLSGTLAAIVLGRAGYDVVLVDRHADFPREFRVEKIAGDQVVKMEQLGLLDALSGTAVEFNEFVNARRGHVLDRSHGRFFGIFYDDLIRTMRAQLPDPVRFVVGRVNALKTDTDNQTVSMVDGTRVTARLIVLATGMGDILRRDLGIERHFIRQRQSLSFGFNIRPVGREAFEHQALTYYGERRVDGIDYLNLFPAADTMRANLFVFRDHRDPWTKALRQAPKETLTGTLPGLTKVFGDFGVVDRAQAWLTDITVAQNCRQDGVVLIGDAYQTSCPAAGTGVSRLLTDVERLCTVHVPQWLETPRMTAAKIAAFYEDEHKQAMDARALALADFRRNLTIETGLRWGARRRIHFARRRVMNEITRISPSLAQSLRSLRSQPPR